MTNFSTRADWHSAALKKLWEAARRPEGLEVQHVKELLLGCGVVIDFGKAFPDAPAKDADLRAMHTAGFQHDGAPLKNMRDWLQAYFPVYFYGETAYNQNEVVFIYASPADYAAARMEYVFARLKPEERTRAALQQLLRSECGLTETDMNAALRKYSASFVPGTGDTIASGSQRLCIPISDKVKVCLGQEMARAIRAEGGSSLSTGKFLSALPCLKFFYDRNVRNGFGNWVNSSFPADEQLLPHLQVEGHPPMIHLRAPAGRDGRRMGKATAVPGVQEIDPWQETALKALWEAAHRGPHTVSVGSKEVTAEGLTITEVEGVLKACDVSWRSCRLDEFQTIENWLEQYFPVCLQEVAAEGWSYTRVLFKFVSLSDYAAVRIWAEFASVRAARHPGGDGVQLSVVKNQLARNYGIWDELVDEAVERYPEAYSVREKDGKRLCSLLKPSTRTVVPMPDEIRAHTNRVLKAAISAEPTGRLRIDDVHLVVPWIYDYHSKELRVWLPGVFYVEIPEEYPDCIRICDDLRWSMLNIRDQLRRCLGQSVRISELPALAEEAHFDLRSLMGEMTLEEWSRELAQTTEVEITRDGGSVYVPLPREAYPAMAVLPRGRVDAETRQAQGYCHFSWDALRQLPEKSGYPYVDVYRSVWQRYIGGLMADAFAGVNGEMLFDENHVPMRAALNMRLTTPEGSPLYAVMEQTEEGSATLFRLLGVVVPGMDAQDELGRYLYEAFRLTSGSATQLQFEALTALTGQLEALSDVLTHEMEEAAQAIRGGMSDLPGALADHMAQWQTAWQELESVLSRLGWRQDFADGLTLSAVRDRMQSMDAEHQMIESAIGRFDAMLSCVDAFIENDLRSGAFDAMRERMLADRKTAASSRFSTREDVSDFRQLLAPYEALRTLAQAGYDDACEEALPVVCSHFRLTGFNTRWLHGAGSGPDMPLSCLNVLDEIGKALDNILAQLDRRTIAGEKKPVVDASVLFDQLCTRSGEGTVFPVAHIFPEDELEAMIVRGEMATAAAWVREQTAPDANDRELMLSAIREVAAGDMSMALGDIGLRLMRIVGNRSRSAERYLLSACLHSRSDLEEYRRVLLDIYSRENRADAFSAIFRDVRGEHAPEHRIYYARALAQTDPAAMKAYLEQHFYLLYDPSCHRSLHTTALQTGDAQLTALLDSITPLGEVTGDALSEAIEAGDWRRVARILEGPEYEGRALTGLREALADTAMLPAGSDPASRGRRLFVCLGSWRRLAERRLLDALASSERDVCAAAAVQLTQLLRSEERWAECSQIYEHYSRECAASEEARLARFLCSLKLDVPAAMESISTSMQNLMTLYLAGGREWQLVTALRESPDAKVAAFFTQAAGLCAYLNDEFYRSVILPGRNLRELLAQPERVRDLGLSDAEEERIKQLRRTNDYPRDMYPAAIAERVYRFMGVRGGVAEAFAVFAPLTHEVAELLRRIYTDAGETHELVDLMQAVPTLRAEHRDEYCSLLYTHGDYAALQVAFTEAAPETTLQRMIAQILSVHMDGAVNGDFALTSAELMQCDRDMAAQLFSALGRCQLTGEIYRLASDNIEKMLTEWPAAAVMDMITGGGALDQQALLGMQQSALADDCDILAIVLWTHLKVGDVREMADQVYARLIREAAEASSGEAQSRALAFIGRVFPDHSDALAVQRIILDVQQQLAKGGDTAAVAAEVAGKIDSVAADTEQLSVLLGSMPAAVLREDAVINAVAPLAPQDGMLRVCLEHYHRAACETEADKAEEPFVNFVTRLYQDALDAGLMPMELADEAAAVCARYAACLRTESALMCSMHLEEHVGRIERAEFVLHEAMELAEDDSRMDMRFREEVARLWPEGERTLMQLFQQVLTDCSYEELLAYCTFCGQFVEEGEDARLSGAEQALLTEAECDQLLYGLYAHPREISRWFACADRLPLQGDPKAQALLRLYSCRQPMVSGTDYELRSRGQRWKACAEFCASRTLDERLLDTLISWADHNEKYWRVRSMFDLPKVFCEFIVDYEKANGGIPDVWVQSYPDKTRALQQRLVGLITDSEGPLQRHAMTACSGLTVKLNDPDILDHLIRQKQRVMLEMRSDQTAALAARLLLAGRIAEAGGLIRMLMDAPQVPAYRPLLAVLAPMSETELTDWCAQAGNRALLGFMLPNGDMPPLEVAIDWCMAQMRDGLFEDGRTVFRLLCLAFPKNRPFCRMLFYMCKNCGMERSSLHELHRALRAIISCTIHGETELFEIRSVKDFAYMLAGLNSVLMDRAWDDTEDYDFAVPAGDYLRSCSTCTDEEIYEINEWQRSLNDIMQNQQEEARERICRVVVSWITGDWREVLTGAWLEPERWAHVQSLPFPGTAHGFGRSFMRFLMDLPMERWNDALIWMNAWNTPDRKQQIRAVDLSVERLRCVSDQNAIRPAMTRILSHPLEEVSMARQIINAVLVPSMLSDMSSACQYTTVMLSMMANVIGVSACNKMAYSDFRNHDDRRAAVMLYALRHVCDTFNLAPKTDIRKFDLAPTETEVAGWVHRFRYLRYATIKLSDDPQLFSESMEETLANGNYCNLVLTLLCSDRANEALLLRRRLPRSKRPIVDLLLKLINSGVTDAAKVEAVQAETDETIRMSMLFLLSLNLNKGANPASSYLYSPTVARSCKTLYDEEYAQGKRGEWIYWRGMRPNELRAAKQIEPPALEEDELDLEEEPVVPDAAGDAASQETQPDDRDDILLAALTLLDVSPDGTGDPEEISRKYVDVPLNATEEKRRQHCDTSLRLYCMAMAGAAGLNRYEWLVRHALDAFLYQQESDDQVRQLLLLAAQVIYRCGEALQDDFAKQATAMLTVFFSKRRQTLREFLDEYRRLRAGYSVLCGMLNDEESAKTFTGICKVLDALATGYAGLRLDAADKIRSVLRDAEHDLQEIKCPRHLSNVTIHLHSMLLTEFNNLDAQPCLRSVVLNVGASGRRGSLYGQVENTGRTDARSLRIWATFGDGTHSEAYCLGSLAAKGKAVFDIPFEAPADAASLDWQLDIRCVDRDGNDCTFPPESGSLALTDKKPPFFMVEEMNLQTVMDFELNDDGTDVESEDFVGRENEKRSLRNLYDGKDFARCRNAVLYGIRRSGKTSLLYYIEKYLNATRQDLMAVLVADQSLSTIWEIFAWGVLRRLRIMGGLDEAVASQLEVKWKPQEQEDMDPHQLLEFYLDVKKALGGRGLVIIIDEFDRLLEKLDNAQKLEGKLYPVLSSMFCDDVCAQTVHFLFCGGMELKREMYKDKQVTQVFQRLGETDIVIGAMPKQEMYDMVLKPYSIYPHVVFTDAALEWLWSIAGGLIWFSKLIAKDALALAKKQGRSVVYPSDILRMTAQLAEADEFCNQLFEGFREDEKMVVEVMGNLAVRPDQFVKVSSIADTLQEHIGRDRVERALSNMVKLRIIEAGRQAASQYRFCTDFYRRYFRVQIGVTRIFPKTPEQDVCFRTQAD